MEQQLNELIIDILRKNEVLVAIAIKQRAKFEGWLKFELAYRLLGYDCNLKVEYPYPNNANQHADIFADGVLIELKAANTNYKIEQCQTCTRPITKNISSIIDDIKKLRNAGGSYKKNIAFILFPIDSGGKYKVYIKRIEEEGHIHLICKLIKINGVPILVCSAEVSKQIT